MTNLFNTPTKSIFMKRFLIIGALVFALMVIGSAKATSYDCGNCIDCSNYLTNSTSGDIVNLVNDITLTDNSQCIETINMYCIFADSNSDNMTFNGNNFLINESVGIICDNPVEIYGAYNVTIKNLRYESPLESSGKIQADFGSSSLTFDNITTNDNTILIYGGGSIGNNIIRNCNLNAYYNAYGIFVDYAWNTSIYNNTINALYPIVFYNMQSAEIYDNNLISTLKPAITSIQTSGTVGFNTVYNNILNSTTPYCNITVPEINYFNMNKTLGTNIVNGIYLGGNYYANDTSTGYSDSCTDLDLDGICDSPFELNGSCDSSNPSAGTDYYPLTLYSPIVPVTISIEMTMPTNTTYITASIALFVSANTTIDTWWYSLNNGANVTFTPNTTITATSGQNHLEVWANDSSNNEGYSDVWFTFTTPPSPSPSVNVFMFIPIAVIVGLGSFLLFIEAILSEERDLMKRFSNIVMGFVAIVIIAVLLGIFLTG